MKIVLITTHIPDPRINKRIKVISSVKCELTVIYWERTHGYGFHLEPISNVRYISYKATNVRNLFKRLWETFLLQKRSLEAIKNIQPDLIFVSGIEAMPVAKKYKSFFKSKVFLEIADLPASSYINKYPILGNFIERFINFFASFADAYIFTSPFYFSHYYKEKLRISQKNVFIFENAPEKQVFTGFQKKPHETFRVGFIGGVRYFKSIQTLFKAAEGLSGIEVLIAGKGPDYEAVLKEADPYSNVKVTGEYIYAKDIKSIYSDVDLVYAVYDTKDLNERLALPNKLYEAIVCEIPIVVASDTCLEEYVKELGVGFSVPHGDVESLRNLLMSLKDTPNSLKEIAQKQMRIKDSYYHEAFENAFIKWFHEKIKIPFPK
jgi:succinoglycan biosynthesis protein ExoL